MTVSDEPTGPATKLRALAPRVGLVVLGFALGAAAFGFRSCGQPEHSHEGAEAGAPGDGDAENTIWTCSMHPQIQQSEPGPCPLCGMDLIPVVTGGSDDESFTGVVLSARARALARLRTQVVRRRTDAAGAVRLLGRIEPNESTLRTVTAWTGGRIDRLHVNVTGERVRAGQVIATLYSPEIFAAHQDLIVARRQVQRMAGAADSARRASEAGLEATRERLRLLGVPDGELVRMENQDRPIRAVPIRSPFRGTVIERIASQGAYVTTGAPLYRIANLGRLWIQLDAYESDISRLSLNQSVRVTVEAFPGEDFEGTITFIDPTLDPRRRTARVRVEVDNQDGRLRPGMFAQAVVAAEAASGADAPLLVPASAPLFTGRRAIVYLEVTSGDRTGYEPRTVRLGPRLGSFYPVVAGLSEGDRVVTRGAFAIDADLQIRGGASMMTSPDDREPGPWDTAIDVPRTELRRLAPVVAAYLSVQRALAADDLARAQAAATEMVDALPMAELDSPQEAKLAWADISASLAGHARHIVMANSIERARTGFEELSNGIAMLLRRLGNPLDQPVTQAHCPMAFGSQGASWIQQGEEVNNAYFGESMLSCGEVEHRIEPGAHMPAPEGESQAPRSTAPAAGHQH